MADGYSMSSASGTIASGEIDTIWKPRSPRAGKHGVILCHAYTFMYTYSDPVVSVHAVQLAAFLASNGITCISGQMGNADVVGDNWANDQAMSRVTAAWNVLIGMGCDASKVNLLGISMGGATVARWAMLNPSSVGAVYGIMPVSDISDIYVNQRVSNARTSIGGAWGVTYPTPLPAGADLAGQASLAAAVPCRLDYGSADTTVIPSTVAALAAAWGANCTATVTDTTNNHGDGIIANTSPSTVLNFFVANGS